MTKLQPLAPKTFYNFINMCDEIDEILGYNQRYAGKHFFPESGGFDDWWVAQGSPEKDANGDEKGSSRLFYSQFRNDVDTGKFFETPYMDFWHWQIDNTVGDHFANDTYSTVYVGLSDYMKSKAKPWQWEIQKVWHDTYKDIADDGGTVSIWVSW